MQRGGQNNRRDGVKREEKAHFKRKRALAGVTQWIEHGPVNQRVSGSIPSQGTCLGCGPGPQSGTHKG